LIFKMNSENETWITPGPMTDDQAKQIAALTQSFQPTPPMPLFAREEESLTARADRLDQMYRRHLASQMHGDNNFWYINPIAEHIGAGRSAMQMTARNSIDRYCNRILPGIRPIDLIPGQGSCTHPYAKRPLPECDYLECSDCGEMFKS
jgi:hypothetical protein